MIDYIIDFIHYIKYSKSGFFKKDFDYTVVYSSYSYFFMQDYTYSLIMDCIIHVTLSFDIC